MPRAAPTARLRRSRGSPTCQSPVPGAVDGDPVCPAPPASTRWRITASAVGERQMLPRQTKQTRTTPPASARAGASSRSASRPSRRAGGRVAGARASRLGARLRAVAAAGSARCRPPRLPRVAPLRSCASASASASGSTTLCLFLGQRRLDLGRRTEVRAAAGAAACRRAGRPCRRAPPAATSDFSIGALSFGRADLEVLDVERAARLDDDPLLQPLLHLLEERPVGRLPAPARRRGEPRPARCRPRPGRPGGAARAAARRSPCGATSCSPCPRRRCTARSACAAATRACACASSR